MHFVRRFKSLPLASACFLSALLTLPALAEWQVNSATSPTILSNAETGWTLTVKMETGGLILQSTTAGEGRLDLTDVETDTGWKVTSVRAPAATTIGDRAFVSASLLTNLVMRGSSTAVPRYTFSGISAGARIWWLGKEAPVSFGAITLAAGTGTDRARVYVKNGHDRENWERRCTRTAPTAADMALADYPGAKRLIGVMGNTAWVLRTGDDGTMIRLL